MYGIWLNLIIVVAKLEQNGIVLTFWDLGGQEELRSIWDKFFKEAHGVVYLVDASCRERLTESISAFCTDTVCQLWFVANMVIARILCSANAEGVPILILANKQDQANAMSAAEIKAAFAEVSSMLGARHCRVQPSSGLSG